jgi:RNA polymerase sigma-70 factor (ECF subfamily)
MTETNVRSLVKIGKLCPLHLKFANPTFENDELVKAGTNQHTQRHQSTKFLMTELSNNDREDLKRLVVPLVDDLHAVALSLTRNDEKANELVAETVAKAAVAFPSLNDRTKVKAWLMRILHNAFISEYRTRRRYPQVEYIEEQSFDDDAPYASVFKHLEDKFLLWWESPERKAISSILDEDIRKAISELPNDFRMAVILCDVEGLSYQEIAEALEIPIGTVRSRIARGRAILHKKLWQHAKDFGLVHEPITP